MGVINITNARKNLYSLIENVSISHEPLLVTGKKGAVVIIAESDYRSIEETLYLNSIPGMKVSIIRGLKKPLNKCSSKLNW